MLYVTCHMECFKGTAPDKAEEREIECGGFSVGEPVDLETRVPSDASEKLRTYLPQVLSAGGAKNDAIGPRIFSATTEQSAHLSSVSHFPSLTETHPS